MSRVEVSTVRFGRCLFLIVVLMGIVPLVAVASDRRGRPTLASTVLTGPGVANHPVRIVPTDAVRIPDGWPLDVDGTIMCRTCHYEVSVRRQSPGASLRDFDENQAETSEFCLKCHVQNGQRTAAAMHWMAVGVAHVRVDDSRSASTHAEPSGLDAHTRRCLGCHDGVSAGDSLNQTPWNRGRGFLQRKQRNHPVGVEYPRHSQSAFSVPFRPASLLPEQVQLPDGRVSCLSCHDLYAEDEYLLTVSIRGSELCFTCHDLR